MSHQPWPVSGTERPRQILRARLLLISVWRESLPPRRSWDSSKVSARRLRASGCSHACGDAAAGCSASFENHGLSFSVGRDATQPLLATIVEDQRDSLSEA